MKTRQVLMVVGVLGAAVSGCQCTGRDVVLSRSFTVDVGPEGGLCSTMRQTISLGDDPAIQSIKDNIGKVELRKVSVTVTKTDVRTDSEVTMAHGTVSVLGTSATGAGTQLGTYAEVPIVLGTTQDVAFDPAGASALATLALTPPNSFDVVAEGCNDKVPAGYEFRVDLTVYLELKLF